MIYKKIISILLFLVLIGCGTVKTTETENIDRQWAKDTLQLVNLGQHGGDTYVDFSDAYFSQADIYETYYLLEVSEMYDLKIDNGTANFIESQIEEEHDIWGLINLLRAAKIVNIGTGDLLNKIQKEIYKLDLSIEGIMTSTENYEEALYLYKELANTGIIDREKNFINYINRNIDQKLSEVKNDKLHVANPILYINGYNQNLSHQFINNISNKIIKILNEKGDLWELSQLTEILSEYSQEDNIQKPLQVHLNNIENLTNMQLFYLLEANHRVGNDIEPFREAVLKRLENCKTESGGYTAYRFNAEVPSAFTYFAIYIKNYLGEEVTDETLKMLFKKIITDFNEKALNEIDWREVYSFLIINSKKTRDEEIFDYIKKGLNENQIAEMTLNQGYYFYKVLKIKDLVPDRWLEEFTDMLEKKLDETEMEQSHLLYIYYSELVANKDMRAIKRINEKIKNTINQSNSFKDKDLFYYRDGVKNTLTTLSYLVIDENLRLNLINWNEVEFRNELNNYKYMNGGYSLVVGEKPDLFNTLIGVMLAEKIEGKSGPIIF